MSELSQSIGGPPFKVTIGDKTYSVGLVTNDIKIAYEKALYAKGREAVVSLRQDLTSEEYIAMMTGLADAHGNGDFAIEGKRGLKALSSPRGSFLILSLLFNVDESELLKIILADEAQVMSVFKAVLKESFPGVDFKDVTTGDAQLPKAPAG
jgi:hypothetical protein